MTGRIFQKLIPGIWPGQQLTLTGSRISASTMQGEFDGGCAIHAAASALAILGCISHPGEVTRKKRGPEFEFWQACRAHYLDGIALNDLAALLRCLPWKLRVMEIEAGHCEVLTFVETELRLGRPVIVSWRSVGRPYLHHAVLAVGLEQDTGQRKFRPHAVLTLDSNEGAPGMAMCNARIENTTNDSYQRSANYVTAWATRRIVLASAISLWTRPAVDL